MAYDIKQTDYRDVEGKLLWSEPMVLKNLWAVGDKLIHDCVMYRVHRVAVADTLQHVNLTKIQKWFD